MYLRRGHLQGLSDEPVITSLPLIPEVRIGSSSPYSLFNPAARGLTVRIQSPVISYTVPLDDLLFEPGRDMDVYVLTGTAHRKTCKKGTVQVKIGSFTGSFDYYFGRYKSRVYSTPFSTASAFSRSGTPQERFNALSRKWAPEFQWIFDSYGILAPVGPGKSNSTYYSRFFGNVDMAVAKVPDFREQFRNLIPPEVRKDIRNYYAMPDAPDSLERAALYDPEDPEAEIRRRIQMAAEFPPDKASKWFARWVRNLKKGTYVANHCPDSTVLNNIRRGTLYDIVEKSPSFSDAGSQITGYIRTAIGVEYKDFNAFIKQFRAYIASYPADKASELEENLKDALRNAIEHVMNTEGSVFNTLYFAYLGQGGMPVTMIQTASRYYNKVQQEKAEKAAKSGLIFKAVTAPLMAIPGAGTWIYLGINTAMQYGDIRKAQQDLKTAEAQSKEVQQKLREATESIEQQKVEKEQKKVSKVKKYGTIGAAAIAAIAGIIALQD